MKFYAAFLLAALFVLGHASSVGATTANVDVTVTSGGTSDEEFVGPFANWQSVKASPCSAAGDGSTDDTAAIQTCLNLFNSTHTTLYFPAGTYKIIDVATTATASSGATSITVASSTGIKAGMLINGTNIQPGTVVRSTYTPGSTTVPLNLKTAGALSATAVKFSPGLWNQSYVRLIGHDRADTTLAWYGSSGGTMFGIVGVTSSSFNRLTFDGRSIAGVLVEQTFDNISGGPLDNVNGQFDSANEYTDDEFKSATTGLRCGIYAGCAETSMLRDKFTDLSIAGVLMNNQNALDMWIWYSTFTNCNYGATNNTQNGNPPGVNGAGDFKVYNSIFSGSTYADVTAANAGNFVLVGNYSSGSNYFVNAGGAGSSSSNDYFLMLANTILDTTNTTSFLMTGDMGPLTAIDNIIGRGSGVGTGPLINVGGDVFSMGNTYSANSPVTAGAHKHEINDTIVSRSSITATAPTLPGTPANNGRTIFEVTAGSSAATIQTAINNAVAAGTRSVVHLQAGNYSIGTTLTTPANADIQIIGDGGYTFLTCTADPCLKLNGPSKVVLRDFRTTGSGHDGIEINTADQVGSRVFMDQVLTGGSVTNTGVFYDTLDNTLVELHDYRGIVNSSGIVVKVVGGSSTAGGTWLGGRLNIFSTLLTANDHNLDVSAGGHLLAVGAFLGSETISSSTSLTATGPASTAVTLAGSQIFVNNASAVSLTNFRGKSALVEVPLMTSGGTATITGTGTGASNLGLAMAGLAPPFYSDTSTGSTMEFLNGIDKTSFPNVDLTETTADPTFLGTTLAQLRTNLPSVPAASPAGVTDVRMYRVYVELGVNNVHVKN